MTSDWGTNRDGAGPAEQQPAPPSAASSELTRWKAIVERAVTETGAAYASLLLSDRETGEWRQLTWRGRQLAPAACAAVRQWMLSRTEPLFLPAAAAGGIPQGALGQEWLPLLCAPVVSNALVQGALVSGSPASAADFPRWQPLLQSLAELAGALLENASLQTELSRKEGQVRDLIRNILNAQEAEREHICLEIHDGVAQTLASAFQHLQTLETTLPESTQARQLLVRASALTRQAIHESREVINSLQPATLRDLGLVATLRQEMRQLEAETGWRVEFLADNVRLSKDVETGLYRIIQEAVANARKHSGTSRLRLTLKQQTEGIAVEVKDWGVGFKPFQEKRKSPGLGFHSMKRRASLWGGSCNIESAPGQGTTVLVEIPSTGGKDDPAHKDPVS